MNRNANTDEERLEIQKVEKYLVMFGFQKFQTGYFNSRNNYGFAKWIRQDELIVIDRFHDSFDVFLAKYKHVKTTYDDEGGGFKYLFDFSEKPTCYFQIFNCIQSLKKIKEVIRFLEIPKEEYASW